MAAKRIAPAQVEMKFRVWGGQRKNAGRKKAKGRRRVPHLPRPQVRRSHVLHVSLRVVNDVARLRRRDAYRAVHRAARLVLARADFRICHISIQHNHIHLLCEAENEHALARGLQAFKISTARQLNRAQCTLGADGKRTSRKGPVFADRYHVEVITSPRHIRHELAYVLNNWRKHGERRHGIELDPYSTAGLFDGWNEAGLLWHPPDGEPPLPVASPQSWLLRVGWQKHPPISVHEVPGPRRSQ